MPKFKAGDRVRVYKGWHIGQEFSQPSTGTVLGEPADFSVYRVEIDAECGLFCNNVFAYDAEYLEKIEAQEEYPFRAQIVFNNGETLTLERRFKNKSAAIHEAMQAYGRIKYEEVPELSAINILEE